MIFTLDCDTEYDNELEGLGLYFRKRYLAGVAQATRENRDLFAPPIRHVFCLPIFRNLHQNKQCSGETPLQPGVLIIPLKSMRVWTFS